MSIHETANSHREFLRKPCVLLFGLKNPPWFSPRRQSVEKASGAHSAKGPLCTRGQSRLSRDWGIVRYNVRIRPRSGKERTFCRFNPSEQASPAHLPLHFGGFGAALVYKLLPGNLLSRQPAAVVFTTAKFLTGSVPGFSFWSNRSPGPSAPSARDEMPRFPPRKPAAAHIPEAAR